MTDPLWLHGEDNLAQLELEVHRQRELVGRKIGNTYTRASLLVGSAGILGGITAGTSPPAWVLIVGVALYLTAALCGLIAMRPMSGDEVDVEALIAGTVKDDVLEIRRVILASNLTALGGYEQSFSRRGKSIVLGFVTLVVALLVTAGGALPSMISPSDAPLQVEIVEGR